MPTSKNSSHQNSSKKTHLEDILSEKALTLVNEASKVLKAGIEESAAITTEVRTQAHQKAHELLSEAKEHLEEALKSSTNFLKKTIDKTL